LLPHHGGISTVRAGTTRNENQYFFTYSLANIGSFGNLRGERLY
jgi:hypothetical protein